MKTLAFLILVILLFSATDIQATKLEYYDTVKAKETPKRVVRDFFIWYKNNRENLEKFDLVLGKPGDSTIAYRVNFQEVEKYLNEFKKSGFVSDKYIASFRKYFEESDATLKKYPQYDGPAQGFGFDLVLKAHDYDELLDQINKAKVITKPINAESVKVYLRLPNVYLRLQLSRKGNTWLIDSLDYV